MRFYFIPSIFPRKTVLDHIPHPDPEVIWKTGGRGGIGGGRWVLTFRGRGSCFINGLTGILKDVRPRRMKRGGEKEGKKSENAIHEQEYVSREDFKF